MPTNDPTPSPLDDVTLIPPDESVDLPNPTADIDADDTAVINAQAAIEKDTIDWSEGFRKFQNYEVAPYFEKVSDDSLPMQSQKDYWMKLCTITEDDGLLKAIGKYLLFDRVRGFDRNGLANVYGAPVEHFQSTTKFHPQITIIFKELTINDQDLPLRNYYLEKEVSIKLLKENIPKSEEELEQLRVKIVDIFGGFVYTSSPTLVYTYRDKIQGLYFAVSAERETSKTIIEKALSIQSIDYDDRLLVETSFPVLQSRKVDVLGKQVDEPTRGKWGEVRFNRIEYKQGGIVDRILRP